MRKGDAVKWRTVNGIASGYLIEAQENGDWLVLVAVTGKYVVVNETSFIDG